MASEQQKWTSRRRQDEALRLKVEEGKSYRQIAPLVGYSNEAAAWRAVQTALNRQPAANARELRAVEFEKLDHLERVVWDVLDHDALVVNDGEVVTVTADDGKERQLVDHAVRLKGVEKILNIMGHRAKLGGLYAPTQVHLLTAEDIEAAIETEKAALAGAGVTVPDP